jgi:MFS family permease
MTYVAVLFQIWQMTRGSAWVGGVGIAQAVPLIAFGLFAGSILDRSDRRRAYLTAITGQGACSILLAVQVHAGHAAPVVVLALVAVQSTFGAVGAPAARTFVPCRAQKF